MDKHFTVVIHDENGSREFNVHKMIKKVLIYGTAFFVTLFFVAVGTIIYLNNTLSHIETKKYLLEKDYRDLQVKMDESESVLRKKRKELEELSDSLSEIETLIGLKPISDTSLQDRVSVAKLSSEERATLLELIPNGSPVAYHGITSPFGYRIHPTLKKLELHRGLDMKAKRNTPVYATADGIVEWAGYHKKSGFGNLVILVHVYGFKTYYGHLQKVVVKSGQFVKKGDLIAYSGNSGLSSGPHLHYEIRFIQRPVNPYYFVKWTQKNYNEIFEKEIKVPWKSLLKGMSRIKVVTPQERKIIQKRQEDNVTSKSL